MGAGASDAGNNNGALGSKDYTEDSKVKARNYVPICSPPHYDLTYDSTDSEITELEFERGRKVSQKAPAQLSSLLLPSVSVDVKASLAIPSKASEFSVKEEDLIEEQIHLEEQTRTVESIEEPIQVVHLDTKFEDIGCQCQCICEETETHSPTVEETNEIVVPEEIEVSKSCDLKGVCSQPDICKLRRCQRQVSFATEVKYCGSLKNYCKASNASSSSLSTPCTACQCLDEYDSCDSQSTQTAGSNNKFTCTPPGLCYLNKNKSTSNPLLGEKEEEVMPDYQRYSREQPEKDAGNNHNPKKPLDSENMRDCCRPCCPNRSASLKHNTNRSDNNPQGFRFNHNHQAGGGNRHNSESYVSCRAPKNPLHCKSEPHHQLEEEEEDDSYFEHESRPPRRRSPYSAERKCKNRSYPPGHNFEDRGSEERPHIPLPPAPEHFTPGQNQQPMVPPHRCLNHQDRHHHSRSRPRDSGDPRDPRDLRDPRESEESHESRDTHSEDPEDRKEMYNHNTNRNYGPKKPYSSSPYQHQHQQRQQMKSYPYEEPPVGNLYREESSCSNNCSGYNQCPIHQACRCICMCMNNEDSNYCPHPPPSDDQMSFCSDSSNSCEHMNLAYQSTGDYPELMDELENTLSYRNRLRVQKTMQRFEMLSRQNKNLEKPIFEDEESVRQYKMHQNAMHNREKHEGHDCKCRHCMENPHRGNNYNTRSEALAKRPNYQATPFPRNSGYVEKVARYMDPNLNNRSRETRERKKMDDRRDRPATMTNSNGTWQMDQRKGEWVKVDSGPQESHAPQHQYDFENNYPPLPPRPMTDQMYRREFDHERRTCACSKCCRRR